MQNQVFIISLCFLIFLKFFGFNKLSFLCNDLYGLVILAAVYFNTKKIQYEYRYKNEVVVFFVFIVANMISCNFYRNQDLYESLRYAYFFLYIFFGYFVFRRLEISTEIIEKVIFILSTIFVFCYIFQFINPTKPLFVAEAQVELAANSLAQQRFRLAGQGICSLGFFLSLNKYLIYRKPQYMMLAAATFTCIMLMGFRTLTVALIISSYVLITKLFGFSGKSLGIVAFAILCFFIFFNTSWGERVFDGLINRQDAMLDNEDYIRVVCMNYYLNDYFHSPIEFFFGSGIPYTSSMENVGSTYAKEVAQLQSIGYIYQDWGFIGYSWMWGIMPIICIICYSIKSLFIKIRDEYQYMAVWLLFMLIGSFTTAEMFRQGAFFLEMVILVLIERNAINYETNEFSTSI